MLLALHDRKGTATGHWSFAVGGAILADLMVQGRVTTEPRKRKAPLVDVASTAGLDDPVLDEALRRIRTARRRATPQTWVTRFAHSRELRHRVAGRLVRRGILRAAEDRVLLVFSRRVYPELDPEPERRLVERIREAVLDDREVDADTALLVVLAHSAGLLRSVLDRKALKARKARIEALRSGAAMGEATHAAIQAAQAAAVAATAAISAATTAATAAG